MTDEMNTRHLDREMLKAMSRDELIDLLFMHLRNLWTVDGLYFLGIEEKFGTQAATEIDRNVWEVMGKIEARRLKSEDAGEGVIALMEALRLTDWALDLEHKEVEVAGPDRGFIRNRKCRVQNARLSKGLEEFPCKSVRWGFLKAFAREFDPGIEVKCNVCPPDPHGDDLWCEWEIIRK